LNQQIDFFKILKKFWKLNPTTSGSCGVYGGHPMQPCTEGRGLTRRDLAGLV
jgi:hypothetical protein